MSESAQEADAGAGDRREVRRERMLKVMSYNLYGVKDTGSEVPSWDTRQKLLKSGIESLLKGDNSIKVAMFQEVNEHNIKMLEEAMRTCGFILLKRFPMITKEGLLQYNIIAIREDMQESLLGVFCLPHGAGKPYVPVEQQVIDFGMSDYRTTVFVHLSLNGKNYVFGNIHTDYISTQGKKHGTWKSLNYLRNTKCDYGFLLGDMNMVSHMAECYEILKDNADFMALSKPMGRQKVDTELVNSYHGYGLNEEVNVDFAFIQSNKAELYDYEVIKHSKRKLEGSDHRPVIVTILD